MSHGEEMRRGTATRVVQRGRAQPKVIEADVCVLGAGIAGVSAALEAARLGRKVVLVDGAAQLGGQSVAAIIGTFCGLYSNGPEPFQVTHGIADEILHDLGAQGSLNYIRNRRRTTIVQYREAALARWIEEAARRAGLTIVLSALLRDVQMDGRRVRRIAFVTRYGDVDVEAQGFVDATGDAALVWAANLPCREPETPIFGTQMLVLENLDDAAVAALDRTELQRRLETKGDGYGLLRHDGFVFAVPGEGIALVNMTHAETPLDPVMMATAQLFARKQGDLLLQFLQAEFPQAFARARIRSYGQLGIRQTRWIVGRHHLTADEVRQGVRFPDAIGRCSWPIELHDQPDGVLWEEFGPDHMHWIPLGSMLPPGADNLVAAGRCVDGDPAGLSSIRVMGPCIAMGAAAAHALDLAGSGAVGQIDITTLQQRLADNLVRRD